MTALEHKIPPPVVLLIVAAAMWAIAKAAEPMAFDTTARFLVGVACAGAGLLTALLGIRAFARAKTTTNPVKIETASTLVTGGIFRFTRNPMYAGLTLVLMGWAIYLAVPLAFLGPLLFVFFITRFQIIPEERVMAAKFGTAFADYKARVRRWI